MTPEDVISALEDSTSSQTTVGVERCTGPDSTIEYAVIGVRLDVVTNRVLVQIGDCALLPT